jgi:hypothetical protein
MGYEAVRARLNLLAVLPNLEDVVRYDPEAAELVKGARITIQFIVAGGPKAFVRIADGACTVGSGMAPGVRAMARPGRRWGTAAPTGAAGVRTDASGDAASPGAGGDAASPGAGAGAGDGKEATVVLGFASCAHLNKMFDGKGNPIPL